MKAVTSLIVAILLCSATAWACLWDMDTLKDELKSSPKRAAIIFGTNSPAVDTAALRTRIADLKANPKEDDAAWWNDLAGAHIRLGESQIAAELLESVTNKFSDDYGIHANLGTAYHLLGRYPEAEREIERDLEINPDAHFGLERYHLALLKYLNKDEEYRKIHVYIEMFTDSFVQNAGQDSPQFSVKPNPIFEEADPADFHNSFIDDPQFEKGVSYMASMNQKEPACFVMMGLACLQGRTSDLNLAKASFKKAIDLGSAQQELLTKWIQGIDEHINEGQSNKSAMQMVLWALGIVGIAVIWFIISGIRWFSKNRPKPTTP